VRVPSYFGSEAKGAKVPPKQILLPEAKVCGNENSTYCLFHIIYMSQRRNVLRSGREMSGICECV